MSDRETHSLNDYMADALRRRSEDLVEGWLDWITEEVGLRPARMLPRDAIRDNMPPVIRSIADLLRTPVEVVRGNVEDDLIIHAKVRHDQGYDIEELLKEYDALEHIVTDAMLESLEGYPGDADPIEVARLFLRLRKGLAVITDITVAVYRETEVDARRELHRQLEDYVRTITHELKTPLQAITAGAGMLEEETVAVQANERRRYLGMIRGGIERALQLMDDIRTIALTEGAQEYEDWQPLPIILEAVLGEVRGMARDRGVRIEVDHPLPRISVEPTRIEIALINLISNAIKYSDPEKEDRWVRLEVRPAETQEITRWEVRIADNGLGIPERLQPHVFERHFRAHPHVSAGTGLGLSITRQMIEQAGGRIGFESEEGRGSTFYFVVPALRAEVGEEE